MTVDYLGGFLEAHEQQKKKNIQKVPKEALQTKSSICLNVTIPKNMDITPRREWKKSINLVKEDEKKIKGSS